MEKWKCPDCGKSNKYVNDNDVKRYQYCECGHSYDLCFKEGYASSFHIKNSIESDRDWGKDMNPTEQCRRIDEVKQWKK